MKRCILWLEKVFCLMFVCVALAAVLSANVGAEPYKTTTRVNFRTNASMNASVIKTLSGGTAVEVVTYDPASWSKVSLNGAQGYIKSEYLKKADSAPVKSYQTNTRVNFRTKPSTDSAVIKTLNSGTAVQVVTYDAQNWSKVKVNDTEGYIKSEYLTSSSSASASASSDSVELIEWTSAKKIFKTYTPAKIYDVRTGAVYYVQSFSNGSHADVETLTKDDTAIMKKTFGGRWSWAVRPVWVTIGGHTMAASINGQPHASGTISGNNMDGQVCIHFRGSTTHNGNKAFAAEHQQGVTEAWEAR